MTDTRAIVAATQTGVPSELSERMTWQTAFARSAAKHEATSGAKSATEAAAEGTTASASASVSTKRTRSPNELTAHTWRVGELYSNGSRQGWIRALHHHRFGIEVQTDRGDFVLPADTVISLELAQSEARA